MKNTKIIIASEANKKYLIAEIYIDKKLVALLENECEELEVILYPHKNLKLNYDTLINTMIRAKEKLLNKDTIFQNKS